MSWPRRTISAGALALAPLLPQWALALDRAYALSQYQHTVWTEHEGAPPDISGIAQTPDGYLWLASARGLFRFDGNAFEKIPALGGVDLGTEPPVALHGGPDGSLFIDLGPRHGAAVYRSGRLTTFPTCALGAGVVESDRQTWLLCNRRPVRLVEGRLEALAAGWAYPDADTHALSRDRQGTIWAATSAGAFRLRPGARAFEAAEGIPLAPEPTAPALSRRPSVLGLIDRDGGLWEAGPHGLVHAGEPALLKHDASGNAVFTDTMTRQTGLGAERITALFEDIDGHVWLGTPRGLERFRDNALLPVRLPDRNLAFSIAAGRSGELWAANYVGKLMRIGDGGIREYRQIGPGISCITRDIDGSIWVAADKGKLWHLRDGEVVEMLQVPMEIHGSMITSVSRAPSGELWVGSTINGVIGSYANRRWTVAGGHGGLPARWSARAVLADSRGRVWSGVKRSEIILLDGRAVSRFTVAEGLDAGEIFAIVERGPHIWVGGSKGVAFFDGRGFRALNAHPDNAFSEVNGLVEASNGDLWVHELDAVKRVAASELAKAFANPDYRVAARRFDALDGLYGSSPSSAARATVAEASDGRIWFSTTEGVMSIDPARPRPPGRSPSLRLKSVDVDGGAADLSAPLVLKPRTRSVRFLYSAISPGAPERIRYRYRLDGLDRDWYDAGKRKSITYTSLAAGKYRFRVSSTNESGAWMDNETGFDFRIEPLWYNTPGIRALYGAAGLMAVWLVYRALLRRATRRVRWQMRMRQAERDRIARDLHDTLLQGVHGLTWKIQAIANGIAPRDPARMELESALDNAEELLAESRRRVLLLRADRAVAGTLYEALGNTVSSIAAAQPCVHSFHRSGEEFAVSDAAQVDICDIVREAFLNAIAHGHAGAIDIVLGYSASGLVVQVRDDGRGIDPKIAEHGRPGHWGLIGMRERAQELGGSLEIAGAAGRGTEVTLRLPRARILPSGGRKKTGWMRRLGRKT